METALTILAWLAVVWVALGIAGSVAALRRMTKDDDS